MNALSPTGTVPNNGSNQHSLQTLLDKAAELGAQAGKGKDTQIKMLLSVLDGGYYNAIDLKPGKHGVDKDDAVLIAEAYVKAQGTATTFDHKANNQQKLVSTIRTSIKLGQWPKGGNGEPLATVGNLMNFRMQQRKNPANSKRLKDAANTLLDYARAQLKQDQLIDGTELEAFVWKKQPDPKTATERVADMRDSLQKLAKGNAQGAQDNSTEVQQAIQLLTQRLKTCAAQGIK